MGVDYPHQRQERAGRKKPESPNPYLQALFKVYDEVAKKTGSELITNVRKRLLFPRSLKLPLSVTKAVVQTQKNPGKIAVCALPVCGDVRLDESEMIPVRLAALKFTKSARAQIEKAGGECMLLDEYIQRYPTGEDSFLIMPKLSKRQANEFFGKPAGCLPSTTRERLGNNARTVLKRVGRRNHKIKRTGKGYWNNNSMKLE